MGKWLKQVLSNYIAWWLSVITPVIVGFLAWIQSQPWYIIATFAIIAFGFTFFGINQLQTFRERHKKRITQLPDTEIENIIRNWIDITSYSIQRLEVNEDLYFGFEVSHGGLTIHIERQRKDPRVILMAGQLIMNPKKVLLTTADWERLSGQLSIEMARLGIQWSFTGEDNKWERIKLIDAVILDDSITGFYFRQRIMFVVRAHILTLEIFKEFIRQMPQKPNPEPEVPPNL